MKTASDPPPEARQAPLSGRKAQAARNDQVILDAARTVFINEPAAPVSAVAKEAKVGISALYRRYPSKEVLLQTLCAEGLRTYIEVAEAALADADRDPGEAFTEFLTGIVDADVHSLSVRLGGLFTPTQELGELAATAGNLGGKLVKKAKAAGAIRADFHLNDLAMILEQLTAVRIGNPKRTRELRRRYLRMHFAALHSDDDEKLPGSPPTSAELGERWTPR